MNFALTYFKRHKRGLFVIPFYQFLAILSQPDDHFYMPPVHGADFSRSFIELSISYNRVPFSRVHFESIQFLLSFCLILLSFCSVFAQFTQFLLCFYSVFAQGWLNLLSFCSVLLSFCSGLAQFWLNFCNFNFSQASVSCNSRLKF